MIYPIIDKGVYEYIPNLHSLIDYINSDLSLYSTATSKGYIDEDDDFLIGDSGGFLMKMDFVVVNSYLFTEVADTFRSRCSSVIKDDGYYLKAGVNTIEYKNFWKREIRRRRTGLTQNCKLYRKDIEKYNACATDDDRLLFLHPLHITGDHYNYLNYGRISRTPDTTEKEQLLKIGRFKQKLIVSFPRFWDYDYWNFKVDEFVTKNNFHLAKAKARRKGYSNKRGSQGANTINLNKEVTIIFAASDLKYLTAGGATTDMLKRNLDWYENKTHWNRGYLSEDLRDIELGYKDTKKGNQKFGHRSHAISVSAFNNPDCAIGKQAIEVDAEEAGRFNNLQEFLNVTMSATEDGTDSIGTIRIYGTGGTKGANWAPFCNCFFNPAANDMMPFENIWDVNSRHSVCGFFHPQIADMAPYIDKHGNSMYVSAFCEDARKKENAKKSKNAEDYAIYVSQRANSPGEAFNTDNDNIYSSQALNEHIRWVRLNQNTIHYRDGQFLSEGTPKNGYTTAFVTNEILSSRGDKIHDYITNVPFTAKDDVYGCWRIYNEPQYINGVIPDNLYCVVIDSVGKDKTIKEVTTKNSLNAIYVISCPNSIGIAPDIIQAIYVGRRDHSLTSASEEALKSAIFYGCKVLPETDRGSVVQDFKTWGLANKLVKNPLIALSTKVKESISNEYGIYIGEGDNAVDATINLYNWLYEKINVNPDGTFVYRLHYIFDLPTLIEIQSYNSKGNFDRQSALRIYPFLRAYLTVRKIKASTNTNTQTLLGQIGLYKY